MRINIFSENIHKNIEVDEKKAISVAKKILNFYLKEESIFNSSCLKDLMIAENSQNDTQTRGFNPLSEKAEKQVINCISFDILYCDNEKTHQINKEYRGKDYPADIITFAIFADSEDKFIFDGEINLGEIVISLDKVAEKGKEKTVSSEELVVSSDFVALQRNLTNQSSNNSILETPNSSLLTPNYKNRSPFEDELNFLIAHGIMHLLGFDHQTNEEYTFIMKAQSAALKSLEV